MKTRVLLSSIVLIADSELFGYLTTSNPEKVEEGLTAFNAFLGARF
jgi:hypothetical protein